MVRIEVVRVRLVSRSSKCLWPSRSSHDCCRRGATHRGGDPCDTRGKRTDLVGHSWPPRRWTSCDRSPGRTAHHGRRSSASAIGSHDRPESSWPCSEWRRSPGVADRNAWLERATECRLPRRPGALGRERQDPASRRSVYPAVGGAAASGRSRAHAGAASARHDGSRRSVSRSPLERTRRRRGAARERQNQKRPVNSS